MFTLLINGKFLKPESFTDTEGLPVRFYGRIRWEEKAKRPRRPFKGYSRLPAVLRCLMNLLDELEELEVCKSYRTAVVVSAKLERERDLLALKAAENPDRVSPSDGFIFTHNGVNLLVAQYLGLEFYYGLGIDHVCSSGLDVLGIGAELISSKKVQTAVVVTVNSMASPSRTAYHRNLKVVSRSGVIRPFDRRRDGTIFADGMAVALLCSEEVASKEGLKPMAAITGYGAVSDSHHMFSIREDGGGFKRAIEEALDNRQIDLIKAHATGTLVNDKVEARAYRELFHKPRVTALKPVMGHSVTSSGLSETLYLLEWLQRGLVPAIETLEEPDPDCSGIEPVTKVESWKGRHVLSVAAGFGGFFSAIRMEVLNG